MANSSIGRWAAWSVVGVVLGVAACSSSESSVKTTNLTWNEDIGPLVQAHCGGCHYAGGSGHFDLLHYESMKSMAPSALSAMKAGRMPPWPPSSDCREYIGDRTLPADVLPKFDEWIAGGMPVGAGEPASFMPPTIDKLRADVTANMPEPYMPNATVTDDYRCFILDAEFPSDTWVEGVDVTPGTPQVHHVLTYAMGGTTLEAAIKADADEAGPGYTCFGGPNPNAMAGGSPSANASGLPSQVGAWVPGSEARPLPEGTAMLIAAGSKLVMQVHYNTTAGNPAADQTSLVMQTRADAPQYVFRSVPVAQPKLDIQADDPAAAHSITLTHWGTSATTVVSVAGHMHLLGKSIRGTISRADKAQECLVDIPDWDFQWQMQYRLPENDYAVIQPGDSFKLDCVYDNSAQNQPIVNGEKQTPQDVTWGEGTYDEMCLMYLGTITPYAPPEPGPATACEQSAACAQACNPKTASCMLNCDGVNVGCLTCTIKGLVGCGAIACGATLQAAQECFIPCVMSVNAFGGSLGTCLSATCPDEWKAATECMDPFMSDPSCTDALSACGL